MYPSHKVQQSSSYKNDNNKTTTTKRSYFIHIAQYFRLPCIWAVASFWTRRTNLLKANRKGPSKTRIVSCRGCHIRTSLSRWTWSTIDCTTITECTCMQRLSVINGTPCHRTKLYMVIHLAVKANTFLKLV